MEELTKMQDSLEGVRMKIKIADPEHSHPLLLMWKKSGFESSTLTDLEKVEKKFDSFASETKSEAFQPVPIKQEPLVSDGNFAVRFFPVFKISSDVVLVNFYFFMAKTAVIRA